MYLKQARKLEIFESAANFEMRIYEF